MGLAGEPEHPEVLVRFRVDRAGAAGETSVYLAREIWEQMQPEGDRLEVLLPGHGRFWLRFERPAGDG